MHGIIHLRRLQISLLLKVCQLAVGDDSVQHNAQYGHHNDKQHRNGHHDFLLDIKPV